MTVRPEPESSAPPQSGEIHCLELEVRIETLDPSLAPRARLLEAAERHRRVDDQAVHRDAARAYPPRDLVAALGVLGVDRAVQPVDRAVRLLDRVVDVFVRDERDDRPEDLFLRDRHRRLHVVEHRRLDEPAAVEALRPTAPEHELRALVLALLDVAL